MVEIKNGAEIERDKFGPSQFAGFDMDIVSGRPGEAEIEGEDLAEERKKIGEYEELLADLHGEGGPVVRLVVKELADRANYLMSQDQQCLAMIKVLNSVKMKINFGQSLAKSILNKVAP